MRLILSAISAILSSISVPSFFPTWSADNIGFSHGSGKASPTPHSISGVRAIQRAAAKRRNQRRSRR